MRNTGEMNRNQIQKKLIIKKPENSELIDTAKFYLRAFGATDMSKAEKLIDFWKLFIENKICHFIIAKHKEKAVGCGALVTYPDMAWVAWMATDIDFQKKGIGNVIMKNLMDYAHEMGIKTLKLDATEIGEKLYSKFEFRNEYQVIWYEINYPRKSNDQRGMEITVMDEIPEWCLKLDKEAFGDDRSQLLQLLLKNGGKVLSIENEGYGILWKNRIGPVIAENMECAIAIVRHASEMGAEKIYIPLHKELPNKFIIDFNKKRMGNTQIPCCTRMTYGEIIKENTKNVYASFIAATG
ncbi:MAG: GNAT family N-acetyltransferase [Thermoplasmata archaeon]|nr:MAG: GNAT family N-acetyltransferase [Thermoplasmata archaeon]